ncbi:glycosyltransferase family 2 protein [Rhodobacteraceae bacterium RKSG542]|uniref:glycosyltransferase family 2 protein n=1 Tax=Pseudovibrio flavus TaxID=2529854 RepID=UPI0012BCCFF0|nr:glycosyltransferase family 2 protein [Pseudovibrio flavus]MTI18903.1 glycosyltransferase family 2 protein [Pseudovibrio flavus]
MNEEVPCSVVIPTKDCLEYLEDALQSVLAQEVEGLEIIVIDDGSSDGTDEFLKKFAESNSGLVVIDGPGQGPAVARNIAIERASSDLIAFLDADDVWYPGKLREQIAWHREHPDASFSFTNYRHINEVGDDLGGCFEFWERRVKLPVSEDFTTLEDAQAVVLAANIVGTSTVVAKTESLRIANGFAKELPSAEDWDLWLKLCDLGPVGISARVFMDYLMRAGSETSKREARIEAMVLILSRYEGTEDSRLQQAVKKAQANLSVAKAENFREQGNLSESLREHVKALWLQPDKRTAIAALADAKDCLLKRSA